MGICAGAFNKSHTADNRAANKLNDGSEVQNRKQTPISKTPNQTKTTKTETSDGSNLIVYKMLLLGSGESGKSTLFKRMQSKYGRKMTKADLDEFIASIHDNILDSMKILIYQSRNLQDDDCLMDDSLEEAASLIENANQGDPLTNALAIAVQNLWADKGIKYTFKKRSAYQVADSARYFFEDVNRIVRKGYSPSEQDVLMCRDRTTGVTCERLNFKYEEETKYFDIYDVGGQKSERKAWLNIFKNVNAVLFVVALSEFDQLLFEDEETNRLQDALTVFKMVANSVHFESVPIVLLFNKIDLFLEKLENGVDFTFEDYDGDQDYDSITEYIQDIFEQKNETSKAIITRFICAVDPEFNLDQVLITIVEENQSDEFE